MHDHRESCHSRARLCRLWRRTPCSLSCCQLLAWTQSVSLVHPYVSWAQAYSRSSASNCSQLPTMSWAVLNLEGQTVHNILVALLCVVELPKPDLDTEILISLDVIQPALLGGSVVAVRKSGLHIGNPRPLLGRRRALLGSSAVWPRILISKCLLLLRGDLCTVQCNSQMADPQGRMVSTHITTARYGCPRNKSSCVCQRRTAKKLVHARGTANRKFAMQIVCCSCKSVHSEQPQCMMSAYLQLLD